MVIDSNDSLERLRQLSALRELGWVLSVSNNARLPTCEAEWLRDQIGASNIRFTQILDNDDSGVCAP